jgi:hypothetical protein
VLAGRGKSKICPSDSNRYIKILPPQYIIPVDSSGSFWPGKMQGKNQHITLHLTLLCMILNRNVESILGGGLNRLQQKGEENESFEVHKPACSPVKVREARKRQINFL